MTKFHPGQEVEAVRDVYLSSGRWHTTWCKARIMFATVAEVPSYWIEYDDGMRAEVEEKDIRTSENDQSS